MCVDLDVPFWRLTTAVSSPGDSQDGQIRVRLPSRLEEEGTEERSRSFLDGCYRVLNWLVAPRLAGRLSAVSPATPPCLAPHIRAGRRPAGRQRYCVLGETPAGAPRHSRRAQCFTCFILIAATKSAFLDKSHSDFYECGCVVVCVCL